MDWIKNREMNSEVYRLAFDQVSREYPELVARWNEEDFDREGIVARIKELMKENREEILEMKIDLSSAA